MLYTIITTTANANGKQTTTTTIIDANSAKQAHEQAHTTAAANGGNVRVYPTLIDGNGAIIELGVMRGAVLVARRTALNSVMRGGGNVGVEKDATQAAKITAAARAARIGDNVHGGVINRLFTMLGELNAANARCNGATTAARIDDVMRDYSQDTREFFAVAMSGLIDGIAANGDDIVECYHAAYLTLNRYIAGERAATEHELSTEYIVDGGGDIVSYNNVIASIIKGGDKWTPTSGGTMDAATAARLGDAITTAAAALNPTQKRIAVLLGRGYSQSQIATMMDRTTRTIEKNVAIIRGIMSTQMQGGEFANMVDSIRANTSATATKKRTTEGMERKKASDKATQAARAKAYRERKKAAAAAMTAATKVE